MLDAQTQGLAETNRQLLARLKKMEEAVAAAAASSMTSLKQTDEDNEADERMSMYVTDLESRQFVKGNATLGGFTSSLQTAAAAAAGQPNPLPLVSVDPKGAEVEQLRQSNVELLARVTAEAAKVSGLYCLTIVVPIITILLTIITSTTIIILTIIIIIIISLRYHYIIIFTTTTFADYSITP